MAIVKMLEHVLHISLAIFGVYIAAMKGMLLNLDESNFEFHLPFCEFKTLNKILAAAYKILFGCPMCMSTIYTFLYEIFILKSQSLPNIILIWLMVAGFNYLSFNIFDSIIRLANAAEDISNKKN